ncbi:MAG: hypothetical protein PVF27_08735 [Gemmatimonadales bacterium]|jgi:hypothetical protein
MSARRIIGEGFIAGLIGAGTIAIWFLVMDTILREPLFTPSMLGEAFFWSMQDPAAMDVTFQAVVAYTMVHVLAFLAIGVLAAFLACQIERLPSTLFIAVVFFAAFEFGFYVIVWIAASPILGALAWWSVGVGNAIAAVGMGAFLWRKHPNLREALARHPLGAPVDESADAYHAQRRDQP